MIDVSTLLVAVGSTVIGGVLMLFVTRFFNSYSKRKDDEMRRATVLYLRVDAIIEALVHELNGKGGQFHKRYKDTLERMLQEKGHYE